MEALPSQSISKSLLIATPLFLIILSVLNTSNQISYLFILDFVNNVGGKADIMFLPTFQPQFKTQNLYKDLIIDNFKKSQGKNDQQNFFQTARLPIVNMTNIKQWQEDKLLVQGITGRWLVPILADQNIDSLLMIMNIENQLNVGFGKKSNLQKIQKDQIAIPQELFNRLGIQIGQKISINLAIKNLFNGMKLIQKFQDPTSKDEYTAQKTELNLTKISQSIYSQLPIQLQNNLTKEDVQKIIQKIYSSSFTKQYKVKYVYKQSGLYPSALHNVIIMEYPSFSQILRQFLMENVVKDTDLNIKQYLPKEYQTLWNIFINSDTYNQSIQDFLTENLQKYCLMALCLLKHRQLVYHPSQPLFDSFSLILQKSPPNVQLIALYPFYQQSLNIKYFFGSVIQIFQVVTCVIYFYTMSLIMKQIYQEKQIQVGIWRTLGAGGVKQQSNQLNAFGAILDRNNHLRQQFITYKLKSKLSFREKLFYYYKILVKIGFIYYWLLSTLISIIIYMILKYIFIGSICRMLDFDHLQQSKTSPIVLFLGTFLLCQILSINHIYNIYVSPLVSTIKPIKRTFDQVKIRIIHLSTFGISSQTLMIAIMLIYYGIVSYYWIPFSILDNDGDLQIILFNSIFIFMIFGAIILLSVVQSRIQRLILRLIFLISGKIKNMKMIMLKNIKAKQYKNIKMTIIISVTFAFLLFFSTGINIQIMIVQSFIQRTLGASLVLQNYEKISFNQIQVQSYLNSLKKNNNEIKYTWISSDINSNGVNIQLISQMAPERQIKCQFKVMTPNFLESTFYQYYYPQDYMKDHLKQYRLLPNNVYDGYDSLYKYDNKFNNQSIGKFNDNDTMNDYDPYHINVGTPDMFTQEFYKMAPEEQIINFAASSLLKLQMGSKVGDLYKMRVSSSNSIYNYNIRSKIVHSYKIAPGMDLLRPQAFITQQQAKYLLRILGKDENIRYEKLLITGPQNQLKQIGNKILSMSPQHTQMFQMKLVSQSFKLLEKYLKFYIILISTIMGFLAVLFIFLYTIGKCRDQADMYKMLRAVGLPVNDIRIMIFLQILIRLFVSIVNGILLGIVFSLGFSMQIQEFLMLNTPRMDLSLIMIIALIMFSVFCVTVYLATRYLTKKTVNDTSKL